MSTRNRNRKRNADTFVTDKPEFIRGSSVGVSHDRAFSSVARHTRGKRERIQVRTTAISIPTVAPAGPLVSLSSTIYNSWDVDDLTEGNIETEQVAGVNVVAHVTKTSEENSVRSFTMYVILSLTFDYCLSLTALSGSSIQTVY